MNVNSGRQNFDWTFKKKSPERKAHVFFLDLNNFQRSFIEYIFRYNSYELLIFKIVTQIINIFNWLKNFTLVVFKI